MTGPRTDGYMECGATPGCDVLETIDGTTVDACKARCCEVAECQSIDWNADQCHLKSRGIDDEGAVFYEGSEAAL